MELRGAEECLANLFRDRWELCAKGASEETQAMAKVTPKGG